MLRRSCASETRSISRITKSSDSRPFPEPPREAFELPGDPPAQYRIVDYRGGARREAGLRAAPADCVHRAERDRTAVRAGPGRSGRGGDGILPPPARSAEKNQDR